MADLFQTIFQDKKVSTQKLLAYGFKKMGESYSYDQPLSAEGLVLTVTATAQGKLSAAVLDTVMDEIYTLHLVRQAAGRFVGAVRAEYEAVLMDIAEKCCDVDSFQFSQAKRVISYVREQYGGELEYLWKKSPRNAILRRMDNKKWYGAMLAVSKRKLGIDSDEIAEILDLRGTPEEVERLLGKEDYYPGWHMNKKHWYTVILDGSVPDKELFARIDESYALAKKK